MKSKIIKLKYQKNPNALIDREDVQNYLWNLEDKKELDIFVKVKYKATKKAKVKLTNNDSLVNHFFL